MFNSFENVKKSWKSKQTIKEDLKRLKDRFPKIRVAKSRKPSLVTARQPVCSLTMESLTLEEYTWNIPYNMSKRDVYELYEEIFVDCCYENEPVSVVEGDVVLDCGANIGVYTRFALSKGASKVLCFEPDIQNVECLRATFSEEISEGRVIIFQNGLWNKEEEIQFCSSPHGTLHSIAEFKQPATYSSILVTVNTLDQILSRKYIDYKIDFIKMDIESAERYAVQGAKKTIINNRPKLAIATYHRKDCLDTIEHILKQWTPKYKTDCKEVEIGLEFATAKVAFFKVIK
jgi:FkbM family methyltransferase